MSQQDRISHFSPVLASLDLGYGNTKAVWMPTAGDGHYRNIVMPVGAARTSQALKQLGSSGLSLSGGEIVTIDGEDWVAGVDPLELQRFARPTHENYTLTNEYLALFYAVLAKIGAPRIHRLVTGLPVSQMYGQQGSPTLAEKLIKRLKGVHSVSPSLVVTVDEVLVVPQPAGAFRAQIDCDRSFASDPHALSMVVDIGYFSSDWAMLRGVKIMDEHSGSSTEATSRVLEKARAQISLDYPDVEISEARIESAYRDGRETIRAGRYDIEIRPFINRAARRVCEDVVNAIQKKRRGSDESINTILVAGGGGALIAPFLKSSFPSAEVVLSDQSVLANATGFCLMARDAYRAATKTKQTA